MAEKEKCYCCIPKTIETSSTGEYPQETEPKFDAVRRIWRGKMEKSKLFFPLEGHHILPIWIKFTKNIIRCLPDADADDFYVEMAEIAARKFKHFSEHGWRCLITEYPFNEVECSEHSLHTDAEGQKPQEVSSSEVTTTPSAESISDSLAQLEFLIQLVASSNFSLNLVKTALDPTFEPNYMEMKSPQVFVMPHKYLELDFDNMEKENIRKDLLNGEYDEYILPLQIANEVDDKFWTDLEFRDF